MRRYVWLTVLASLMIAGVVFGASYLTKGTGFTATVGASSSRLSSFTARTVSVYNPHATAILYALVNCTTTEFDAAYATTNTIAIPATGTYTFDTGGETSIDSICMQYASVTGTVYVAAF